ncbi:UNVERIFIED_CONTAM: hypothetical protein Slati_3203300 [Sesamum latifolium]|uniref:NAC domain-containing protein n=1 Tax=Sesamum latifolium TaxID=2727402 RepID=A0AAW2UXJ4_9LAMI
METHKIGTRFEPSGPECIAYLLHKVSGERLASEFFISFPTIDIYGDEVEHPSLIFPASDHDENYFYSRLKKINNDDHQVYTTRASGNGVWAECGPRDIVLDSKRGVLGFLNVFKYEGKITHSSNEEDNNHEWLLKEYTLSDKLKCCCLKMEYVDFMFCMVKRNPEVKVDPEKHSDWFLDSFFDEMSKQHRPKLWKGSSSSADPSHDSTAAEGTNNKRI